MRLREWIANLLDRFPDTCWTALAAWITHPQVVPLGDCLTQSCTDGFSYCGKCWATGRITDKGGAEIFRPQKYWRIRLKRLLGVKP